MSARPSLSTTRLRRQLLAKGFTARPTCPNCHREVAPQEFTAHTTACPVPAAPQNAPAPVNGANGEEATITKGLIAALCSKPARERLERAGAELLRLRQELRDRHDAFTPAERVAACREIARRECLAMAVVVAQLRRRFSAQGSGSVFVPGLHPLAIEDHLREAQYELMRMSDPAVWRIA